MSKATQAAKKFMVHVPAVVLFVLAAAGAGCGESPVTPSPPTPPAAQPAPVLAVFTDPASGFTTSDVRDVQDQIVRFDTARNALIWAADGSSFLGYPVSGNSIQAGHFQVRFGTKNGERRAYLTETGPATICDVEVYGGLLLSILPTTVKVPET